MPAAAPIRNRIERIGANSTDLSQSLLACLKKLACSFIDLLNSERYSSFTAKASNIKSRLLAAAFLAAPLVVGPAMAKHRASSHAVNYNSSKSNSGNFARATKTGKTGTTSHKNKKEAAPFDRNQGSFAGKRRHTD
jgi:hypothetical protein